MSGHTSEEQDFLNPESPTFRFHAQSVFLTYPHASFDFLLLISYINDKLPDSNSVAQFVVCREKHADGDAHVHACIRFAKKLNIRNATRWFDFAGFHPNFGSVRSWPAACRYVKKDGDFVASLDDNQPEKRNLDAVYAEAYEQPTAELAREVIRKGAPRDSWLFHDRIEAKLRFLYPEVSEPYLSPYSPDSFTGVPLAARQWAERYLANPVVGTRPKTLLLLGPSRIGKTAWARSLGPHIYMNGYYSLEKMCKSGDYVVLDDIEYPKLQPILKGVIGCQQEFELTDKFIKKITLKWNSKPCILCWNPDYFPTDRTKNQIDWWDSNVIRVDCNSSFF